MTNLDHIQSLIRHGAQLRGEDGSLTPLTEAFYHNAVEACHTGGYNAATYDLVLPGIDSELWLAIWKDGHADWTATPTPAAQRVSAPALPAEGHRAAQRGLRASFGLFIDGKETGEKGNVWAISRLAVCLVSRHIFVHIMVQK